MVVKWRGGEEDGGRIEGPGQTAVALFTVHPRPEEGYETGRGGTRRLTGTCL